MCVRERGGWGSHGCRHLGVFLHACVCVWCRVCRWCVGDANRRAHRWVALLLIVGSHHPRASAFLSLWQPMGLSAHSGYTVCAFAVWLGPISWQAYAACPCLPTCCGRLRASAVDTRVRAAYCRHARRWMGCWRTCAGCCARARCMRQALAV